MVRSDANQQKWLIRLADLSNGKLRLPNINDDLPKYFDNRDHLYWRNGPSEDGSIGIWHWSAIPRDTESWKDFITTTFQAELHPVQFILVKRVNTIEQLRDRILLGFENLRQCGCDIVFCYEAGQGAYRKYTGLYCKENDLVFQGKTCIKNDVYFLPVYRFTDSDIITVENKLQFVKSVPLAQSKENFVLNDIGQLLYSIISGRMTWPLYKDCIGKTKAEWRECKKLFERACGESLYEEVSQKLGYPLDKAKEIVDHFVQRADFLLDEGDIDTDLLGQIAMHSDKVKAQCEEALTQRWKLAHAAELKAAKAETDQEEQKRKELLQTYMVQLHKAQEEKQTVQREKDNLLSQIKQAQEKYNTLEKEIEEYEALGEETLQEVRTKINNARKDMAGFLAELSPILTVQGNQKFEPSKIKSDYRWKFCPGITYKGSNGEEVEVCENWMETLDLLQTNLQLAGVRKEWLRWFSSFLYSAFYNGMPLLLAGPNAEAIANAISLTIFGKTVSHLKCHGEMDTSLLTAYVEADLVAVENPFHPDWLACMPQIMEHSFSLWLHPFAEDLAVEPKSLWDYVYPVFTECFVDQMPKQDQMIGGQKKQGYNIFRPNNQYRVKVNRFKQFRMHPLLANRLQRVLADAKYMANLTDASMEYLFGLLPLTILSGKWEVLTELIENEKNLSPSVQTEIERHIEG